MRVHMSEKEINSVIAKNLNYYLTQTGKTQIDLSLFMNVSQATISNWCKGSKMPRMDKIDKICSFFNISRSDLMEDQKNDSVPALNKKDEKDIAKKLDETLGQLESSDGLMFDGEVLDEETKELLKISLENALRTAKVTAKKKFTPKKYKND